MSDEGVSIDLQDVTCRLGDIVALGRICLTLKPAEIVRLLRSSGCGKKYFTSSHKGYRKTNRGAHIN